MNNVNNDFLITFRTYFLYATLFITGAVILVIEILGTRVLGPFYGSTIYVWSSLISITLAALALGYWLGGKIIDKKPSSVSLYGVILVAGISLFLLIFLDEIALTKTNSLGIRFGPLGAAFILFSVPLFLLGMVSPMAVKLHAKSLENIGIAAGSLYAVATLGSLFGGLGAGFFFAQYSPQVIFLSLSFILLVLGSLGLVINAGFHRKKIAVSVGGIFLIILLAFVGRIFFTSQIKKASLKQNQEDTFIQGELRPYHPTLFTSEGSALANVIYQSPSLYGDVVVFDYTSELRCIMLDGANESCWNYDSQRPSNYVRNIGHLLESYGKENQEVLVIGLGGGTLLKALGGRDYKLDVVEINPKLPEVAKQYFGLPKDLDFEIFVDDGRHFLSGTDKKYDAIVLDICEANEYSSHLWTKEFFALAKNHLNDPQSGIIVSSLNVVAKNTVSETLENRVANAQGESFTNLYSVIRQDQAEGEYDVGIFVASNQELDASSNNMVNLEKWQKNQNYLPLSDEKLGEIIKLGLPAQEAIRKQVLENFGEKILFPSN